MYLPGGGIISGPVGYWKQQEQFLYEEEKVVLDKYTLIEPDRTRTVYNWLQHFTPEALSHEVEQAGLTPEHRYANVAGDPFDPEGGEFAVEIRREK